MADALAPGLLIAVPQLLDPNFHRSVVFLLEHSNEGAFGFVINRPADMRLGELFEKLKLGPCGDPEAPILVGGPLQPERGMVVHAEGSEAGDSHAVSDSIFVCSSSASLKRLFAKAHPRALFLLGYAGWGPGPLAHELEVGSWIPAPPGDVLIFDMDREAVWEQDIPRWGRDP